ncbi:MAG: hypothetical protein LUI09_03290 [Prevotellaceae bacterium]|nr:hypothetical protein [Prevotellaceae bacterium]
MSVTAHSAPLVASTLTGGFGVIAAAFLRESVAEMIPWLITMFAAILCDLVSALRRCRLTGEEVRISRAVRNTMGKTVTYTSFTLLVCMVEVACDKSMHLDRWACLIVILVEICSVISNLLKPKGYDIDIARMVTDILGGLLGRSFNISDFIHKTKKNNEIRD